MSLIKCQNVDYRPHTHAFVPQFPELFTVFTTKLNSYLTTRTEFIILNRWTKIKAIHRGIEIHIYSTNHVCHWTWTVDNTHDIQIHKICGKSVSRFLSFLLSIINLNYSNHKMLTHTESNASVNFSNWNEKFKIAHCKSLAVAVHTSPFLFHSHSRSRSQLQWHNGILYNRDSIFIDASASAWLKKRCRMSIEQYVCVACMMLRFTRRQTEWKKEHVWSKCAV